MDNAELTRQLSSVRVAQDEMREQICALRARDDLGGLLSPTSVREVMDALRLRRLYTVIPQMSMHAFGWAAATSQIALLDDAVKSPMPSLGIQSSEPPATARKALDSKIAGVVLVERRRNAARTSAAAAAQKQVGRNAWRDAFAGALV